MLGSAKLNMSKADCDLKHHFKKQLDAPSADDKICPPLQMGELLSSIKKIKSKGEVDPDIVAPTFLKSLGSLAL